MPRQETYIEEKSEFVDLLIPFLPQIRFGTPQQKDEAQRTVFQLGAHLNFIKEKTLAQFKQNVLPNLMDRYHSTQGKEYREKLKAAMVVVEAAHPGPSSSAASKPKGQKGVQKPPSPSQVAGTSQEAKRAPRRAASKRLVGTSKKAKVACSSPRKLACTTRARTVAKKTENLGTTTITMMAKEKDVLIRNYGANVKVEIGSKTFTVRAAHTLRIKIAAPPRNMVLASSGEDDTDVDQDDKYEVSEGEVQENESPSMPSEADNGRGETASPDSAAVMGIIPPLVETDEDENEADRTLEHVFDVFDEFGEHIQLSIGAEVDVVDESVGSADPDGNDKPVRRVVIDSSESDEESGGGEEGVASCKVDILDNTFSGMPAANPQYDGMKLKMKINRALLPPPPSHNAYSDAVSTPSRGVEPQDCLGLGHSILRILGDGNASSSSSASGTPASTSMNP